MRATKHSPDLEGLGDFIRQRRRTLGLTQSQLAERLDWVQERVSLLECGKYGMPSVPGLADLAEALESELADVLAAAGFALSGSIPQPQIAEVAYELQSTPFILGALSGREAIQDLGRQNVRLLQQVDYFYQRLAAVEQRIAAVDQLRSRISETRRGIDHATSHLQSGSA